MSGSCAICGKSQGLYGGICPDCVRYAVKKLDFKSTLIYSPDAKQLKELFSKNTSRAYNINMDKYSVTTTRNGVIDAAKKQSIDMLLNYSIKPKNDTTNNYVFSIYSMPKNTTTTANRTYGVLSNGYALKPTGLIYSHKSPKGNYGISSNNSSYKSNSYNSKSASSKGSSQGASASSSTK